MSAGPKKLKKKESACREALASARTNLVRKFVHSIFSEVCFSTTGVQISQKTVTIGSNRKSEAVLA